MGNVKWKEDEVNILKYILSVKTGHDAKLSLIEKIPGKSWIQIRNKSRDLKINKFGIGSSRKENLKSLLSIDTKEKAYLFGLFISDGFINYKDGYPSGIGFEISEKDEEFYENLLSNLNLRFIKCKRKNKRRKTVSFTINDTLNTTRFKEIFDIPNNKAQNPINLERLNKIIGNYLFLFFIAGIIDGDGSIRKSEVIQIEIHKNWIKELEYIENFIYRYFNRPKKRQLSKITNRGFSRLTISNTLLNRHFKKYLLSENIKIMDRKWSRIVI